MDRLSLIVATVFGIGYLPWAPGTFGSLAGLVVPLLLGTDGWQPPLLLLLATVAVLPMVSRAGSLLGCTDASAIVIDEVLGIWLSLIQVPIHWWTLLLAFLLFRLFDIVKPFPVGWLDAKVPGGAGVLADDLAAGAMANGVIQLFMAATGLYG